MANAATEAPAAYVLATQFHDTVRDMLETLAPRHDYLAIELLKYSERIMGNVGAAEAPYALDRRQRHYQIAFAAVCGCASGCLMVHRLQLADAETAARAKHLLASLASLIRPLAEEGMEPRSEMEQDILDDIFEDLDDPQPWEDDEGDHVW